MMVTIHLQPFLPYVILALKNSYWTGIWPSNIITQAEHFSGAKGTRPLPATHQQRLQNEKWPLGGPKMADRVWKGAPLIFWLLPSTLAQ